MLRQTSFVDDASDEEGKEWYLGMKVHVGADVDSRTVHTVEVSVTNEAGINVMPRLLRMEDEVIFSLLRR